MTDGDGSMCSRMRKVPKDNSFAPLQKATDQSSNILMTDERCENDGKKRKTISFMAGVMPAFFPFDKFLNIKYIHMKHIHFILQSKGGTGKSMLTYLLALKNENNLQTYFIDFDSSVKSSTQQLKFLQGKTPPRFARLNLLDERGKIDRQLLFENLQILVQKDYEEFYLDFGAPESEQFTSLFSKDYTIDEFKQIEQELNAEFIFNIVIAGGSSYLASTNYLHTIVQLNEQNFNINIYVNEFTFQNYKPLIAEVENYAKANSICCVKYFGDFDIEADPHKRILQNIADGRGMEAHVFVQGIKIQKELKKL